MIITLSPQEKRLLWLDALEAAGVDNWDGIDEAITIYKQYLADEEEVINDVRSL